MCGLHRVVDHSEGAGPRSVAVGVKLTATAQLAPASAVPQLFTRQIAGHRDARERELSGAAVGDVDELLRRRGGDRCALNPKAAGNTAIPERPPTGGSLTPRSVRAGAKQARRRDRRRRDGAAIGAGDPGTTVGGSNAQELRRKIAARAR